MRGAVRPIARRVRITAGPHRPCLEECRLPCSELAILLTGLTLLAGCSTGFPLAHGPDPQEAATLQETEPLVRQCRQMFLTALAGTKAGIEGGPSIERDGAFTRVTLEARSPDPDMLHPYRWECRFESGTLAAAAMLPYNGRRWLPPATPTRRCRRPTSGC